MVSFLVISFFIVKIIYCEKKEENAVQQQQLHLTADMTHTVTNNLQTFVCIYNKKGVNEFLLLKSKTFPPPRKKIEEGNNSNYGVVEGKFIVIKIVILVNLSRRKRVEFFLDWWVWR